MRQLYNRFSMSISSQSIHQYDDSYKTHIILAKRPYDSFSISIDSDDISNDSQPSTPRIINNHERYFLKSNPFSEKYNSINHWLIVSLLSL